MVVVSGKGRASTMRLRGSSVGRGSSGGRGWAGKARPRALWWAKV